MSTVQWVPAGKIPGLSKGVFGLPFWPVGGPSYEEVQRLHKEAVQSPIPTISLHPDNSPHVSRSDQNANEYKELNGSMVGNNSSQYTTHNNMPNSSYSQSSAMVRPPAIYNQNMTNMMSNDPRQNKSNYPPMSMFNGQVYQSLQNSLTLNAQSSSANPALPVNQSVSNQSNITPCPPPGLPRNMAGQITSYAAQSALGISMQAGPQAFMQSRAQLNQQALSANVATSSQPGFISPRDQQGYPMGMFSGGAGPQSFPAGMGQQPVHNNMSATQQPFTGNMVPGLGNMAPSLQGMARNIVSSQSNTPRSDIPVSQYNSGMPSMPQQAGNSQTAYPTNSQQTAGMTNNRSQGPSNMNGLQNGGDRVNTSRPVGAPETPVSVMMKYSYNPNPNSPLGKELAAKQGDKLKRIRVCPEQPEWVLVENSAGECGYVPSTYTMVIEEKVSALPWLQSSQPSAPLPPPSNEPYKPYVSAYDRSGATVSKEFYCEVCGKSFNGPQPYAAHMASKAHREEVEAQKVYN